ncbi:MAG: hypothetical protein II458_07810 [Oscillospiraceae bacterium]|nr:hypothetical protein [Oscillospiraceae bacterium]
MRMVKIKDEKPCLEEVISKLLLVKESQHIGEEAMKDDRNCLRRFLRESQNSKETDFKKWKYQALIKRDECADGKISVEEYDAWLEASFPNRRKSKRLDRKRPSPVQQMLCGAGCFIASVLQEALKGLFFSQAEKQKAPALGRGQALDDKIYKH